MDNMLLNNIQKLFDCELYEDVTVLADMLHTIDLNKGCILSREQEFQLLLFEANAYYNVQTYNVAEPYFRQAIQLEKNIQKVKNNLPSILAAYPIFCDNEVKYRYAFCLYKLDRVMDALKVLESIENSLRSPKAKMLLARLNQYNGFRHAAKLVYKDILKDCNLSLVAIKSLLELGVKSEEVNSLIASSSSDYINWINNWIKGNDLLLNQYFNKAADAFLEINNNSKLRNNAYLLISIGECFYFKGDFDIALYHLEKAHNIKPHLVNSLMPLAVIYSKQYKLINLEKLISPSKNILYYTSEDFFVYAQQFFTVSKYEKSALYAEKAIYKNPRNFEAYFLKGRVLFELGNYTDSLKHFRNAHLLAPYRFEAFNGVVKCYLATNRIVEAQNVAADVVEKSHQTARSLVLLAMTFMHDDTQQEKIKYLLKKAIKTNPYYLPAGISLAKMLQFEGHSAEALKILKKIVLVYPNFEIFLMLGDILKSLKDMDGALEYYTKAWNLKPTNDEVIFNLASLAVNSSNNKRKDYGRVLRKIVL